MVYNNLETIRAVSLCSLNITSTCETVGARLKASEDALISDNSMKIWSTVTLKENENLVYCNLAAILCILFLSNNIQTGNLIR